jgi:murein DD-endopeptidase MepM/ murein hydrolase activator NlpD
MNTYDFDSPVAARSRRKLPLALGIVLLVGLFGSLGLMRASQGHGPEATASDGEPTEVAHVEADTAYAQTDSVEIPPVPEDVLISGRIRRNENFSDALGREGVSRERIFELVSAVRKGVHRAEFNPNIVQKGDRYALQVAPSGSIQRFEFVKKGSIETRYVAERQDGRLKAWREQVPLQLEVVVVAGEIRDVLWNALAATQEDPAPLTSKLTDIFEFYVDFMVDCRKGDRFKFVIQKYYKDGEFVRYGDILSAEYESSRALYQAFAYETPDGDTGYYDEEARSLRGLFLKSPLNYRRISSGFTNKRFHPILKKYIPHHGIDYAAARGTPVWATASGVVTFVGRKGALGKYVEVRHKNGYKTGYGHLSRYPRSIKKGTRVKQKQTIGYVGATGRATGPHLHFNFFQLRNGRYRLMNPSRAVNRPTGKPVPDSLRADFVRTRDRLLALLSRGNGAVVTAHLEPSADGRLTDAGRLEPAGTP